MFILSCVYEVVSDKENRTGNKGSNAFGQVIKNILLVGKTNVTSRQSSTF